MHKLTSSSLRVELRHSPGLTLHARKWGDAAPRFFLIHGLGENHAVWMHVVDAIFPYGGAVAIDLRGHGDSDHDPARQYETKMHVADSVAAMQMLCESPVILVAHSLGAEVAIHLAAHRPGNVQGLVLVDGGPELNSSATDHIRRAFANQPWQYSTLDEYTLHLQTKLPLSETNLVTALAPRMLRRDPDGGYRVKCDRALTEKWGHTESDRLWSLFRSISFPFLVIRGRGSAVLPHTTASRMVRENARCSLTIVPAAGHSVMLDNPSGFLEALIGYVSSLAGKSAPSLPSQARIY